jgi:hypothetical protein
MFTVHFITENLKELSRIRLLTSLEHSLSVLGSSMSSSKEHNC